MISAVLLMVALAADYRVGTGSMGGATAVVVENAVLVSAPEAMLTPQSADVIAADVLREHGLERGNLLLNVSLGASSTPRMVESIENAVRVALSSSAPGTASVSEGVLSVNGATVLRFCGVDAAQQERRLSGKVSGAYQVIEVNSGSLGQRDRLRTFYPMQALTFGKSLTIVAFGSEPDPAVAVQLQSTARRGHLLITGCAGGLRRPEAQQTTAAAEAMLRRVR